jgi:tubulin polyglutamylase TTLL6/13
VRFCALYCKYSVITKVAKERGWLLVYGNPERSGERILQNCNVYWVDNSRMSEVIPWIEPWVKLNHFPGMNDILARKSGLAKIAKRMHRVFPEHFDFLPETWVLPQDLGALKACINSGKTKGTYIVKPDRGSRGRGIFITNDYEKIRTVSKSVDEVMVAQRYIADPMLIDNFKFDLRLYLLVGAVLRPETGSLDFRMFLFKDGLVRLCTTPYTAPTADNEDEHRMHLTNYAVNKGSANFDKGEGDSERSGSKRSLRWFLADFTAKHGEQKTEELWENICSTCVKTVLVAQPGIDMEYHSKFPKDLSGCSMQCRSFELLGLDVMLDKHHNPWMIEVNCLPSFGTDTALDEDIKKRVINQTLDLTCGDISMRDRASYRLLSHKRRCGQDGADAAGASGGGAGGGASAVNPESDNPLDLESYKDFERVYPVPQGGNRVLAENYDCILEKARHIFRHPSVNGGANGSSVSIASAVADPNSIQDREEWRGTWGSKGPPASGPTTGRFSNVASTRMTKVKSTTMPGRLSR